MKLLLITSLCLAFFNCSPSRMGSPETLLGKWEGKPSIHATDGRVRTGPIEAFLEFTPNTVKIEYVGENSRTIERNYKTALLNGVLEVRIGDDPAYLVSFDEMNQMHLSLNASELRRPDVPLESTLTYRKIE
jgi:hypothetical protein